VDYHVVFYKPIGLPLILKFYVTCEIRKNFIAKHKEVMVYEVVTEMFQKSIYC